MSSGATVVALAPLDWPTSNGDGLGTVEIQRAGQAFVNYDSLARGYRDFRTFSQFRDGVAIAGSGLEGAEGSGGGKRVVKKGKKERNLLTLSTLQLEKLTYYQVLGNLPLTASAEDVKRAYHKACLKYHPDKTGRGEDDEVFLLVKASFDTLIDPFKRKAYDSTADFDDAIPRGNESADEFYKVYGPVFERSLRFDVANDPTRHLTREAAAASSAVAKGKSFGGGGGGGKKGKGGKFGKKAAPNFRQEEPELEEEEEEPRKCPDFGDDETPIEQVIAFYDYWSHFESWRDFTLKAQKETDHHIDAADSRDEKRYMAKEIDRKARAMKRDEMARINNLIERAMAADPRLRRVKEREREERERAQRQAKEAAEREAREKRESEERLAKETAERQAKEKEQKAAAKASKEKEKKMLRKAKAVLRKITLAAFQAQAEDGGGGDRAWDDMEQMGDDVEHVCNSLGTEDLTALNNALGGPEVADAETGKTPNMQAFAQLKKVVDELKGGSNSPTLQAMKAGH